MNLRIALYEDIAKARRVLKLFVYVFVIAVVFFGSLYIGPFYILGDQLHYREIYKNLSEFGLVDGYVYYTSTIDSLEFVHFFFSWLASSHLEKDLFIALANGVLAWISLTLFQKWKASLFIAAFLVVTNYYFIAMYFSAERLKFGFIFVGLSFIYLDRVKLFYTFSFLAF